MATFSPLLLWTIGVTILPFVVQAQDPDPVAGNAGNSTAHVVAQPDVPSAEPPEPMSASAAPVGPEHLGTYEPVITPEHKVAEGRRKKQHLGRRRHLAHRRRHRNNRRWNSDWYDSSR